jgi:hypothetical protein
VRYTYANTGRTDVAKRGRSWLRDRRGRRSSKGVDCNIPRLNRINSILIPLSCNFFSGSPPAKNSGVKRAWPGAISGWVTDREVFTGAQSEDKSAQKRLGLVCRARL